MSQLDCQQALGCVTIPSARKFRAALLGRGVMVAQRSLEPLILVRIRAPQSECSVPLITVVLDEIPISYTEENLTW